MRSTAIVLGLVLVSAGSASAGICSHTAPRRVASPAAGINKVVVKGSAGFLHVTGRPGATEIVATGTACTSDKDFLDEIRLVSSHSGSELRIEAVIPANRVIFGFFEARLDFEVSLPPNVALDVEDGSGELSIANVGPLTVDDGSGELQIRGVHGNLSVEDGSGEMIIDEVAGSVEVTDGSGDITIRRVGGGVVIDEDGSGSIDIRGVQQGVRVRDDGSGSIEVADVKGDFTVEHDGSGGIDYDRVGGKVSIPKD